MLNPTEVHLLVGFMVKAYDLGAENIELGARQFDDAAVQDRDVDILITCKRGAEDFVVVRGIEVKKHRRPLTVEQVEQLCVKFADIPSIREKCLVSASGYTAGAMRKASAHGVELMELRPWDGTTGWKVGHSIAPNIPFRFFKYHWVGMPEVRFRSDDSGPAGQLQIRGQSPICDAAGLAPVIAADVDCLAGAIALQVLNAHDQPLQSPNDVPVPVDLEVPVEFDQELFVQVGADRIRISGAVVLGRVHPQVERSEGNYYSLRRVGDGTPLVGCVLSVAPDDSLIGLMIAEGSLAVTAIRIPLEERLLKQIRSRRILGDREGK